MNKVILTGRVGRDPEALGSGVKVPLGISGYDGEKEVTSWIPVKAFGNLAINLAKNLKKGAFITVEGKLTTYNQEFEDGKKVKVLSVVADKVEFVVKGESHE